MDRPTQYSINGALIGAIIGSLKGGFEPSLDWAIGSFFLGLLIGTVVDALDN